MEKWTAPTDAVASIAKRLGRVLAAPTREYAPFIAEGRIVGWIRPERARRLAQWRGVFQRSERGIELARGLATPEARTTAPAVIARTLSRGGAPTAWRDEPYALSPHPNPPPPFQPQRPAAP